MALAISLQHLQMLRLMLDEEEEDVQGAMALYMYQRRRRRQRRRWWVRPWILRRPFFGQYEQLMAELERELIAECWAIIWRIVLRKRTFDTILAIIRRLFTEKWHNIRQKIVTSNSFL